MGTSAQKMYPTPLVKVVMVMLQTNLVSSRVKARELLTHQWRSCQLLVFWSPFLQPFGSSIWLSHSRVKDSPLFSPFCQLESSQSFPKESGNFSRRTWRVELPGRASSPCIWLLVTVQFFLKVSCRRWKVLFHTPVPNRNFLFLNTTQACSPRLFIWQNVASPD